MKLFSSTETLKRTLPYFTIIRLCVIFIFLFFSHFQLKAQLLVENIYWKGLKKTKKSHLLRFIKHKVGKQYNPSLLADDEQQIINLASIFNVKAQADTINDKVDITFEVEEAITFFPIVNFGGLRDNVWIQLGATEQNILGRGIQATAFYQNTDRRHNGQLHVRIPYLKGSKWGVSFGATRWASVEPLFFGDTSTVFFLYDNRAVSSSMILEFGLNHTLEVGGSYFVESYRKDERHNGETTPGPASASLPKLLYKLTHRLDRRNYYHYLLRGWYLEQNLQFVQNLTDKKDPLFWMSWTDFHVYLSPKQSKLFNIASRLRLGLADNRDSPFAPFVLDSHVNIRGAGNRIDRGTASFVWNLEYRQTLIDVGHYAAQGVVFSDLGTWRKPGGALSDLFSGKTTEHFLGIGIRLIYKKMHNAILRADYGFDRNDASNNGWVLGIGQYF